MYETIEQKIDVIAVFGRNYREVKPFKIRWGARDFLIKKVGYVHLKKEGGKMMHIFSVTDGSQFFELRFDPQDLSWFLAKVWSDDTQ